MNIKENKPKIVLVSNTSWYIYNFRLNLLYLINNKNYDLHVICPEDKYTKKIEELGFKIYHWPLNRRSLNPISELVAIYRLIKIL